MNENKSCHDCIHYEVCICYDFLRTNKLQPFFENGMISYFAKICKNYKIF